jgi:hypothetical protein
MNEEYVFNKEYVEKLSKEGYRYRDLEKDVFIRYWKRTELKVDVNFDFDHYLSGTYFKHVSIERNGVWRIFLNIEGKVVDLVEDVEEDIFEVFDKHCSDSILRRLVEEFKKEIEKKD